MKILNSAVGTFRSVGGDLSGVTDPVDVIDQLKAMRMDNPALKDLSITIGSNGIIDARIECEVQTAAEAATDQPRILWDTANQQFILETSGPVGICRINLGKPTSIANLATIKIDNSAGKNGFFRDDEDYFASAAPPVAAPPTGPAPAGGQLEPAGPGTPTITNTPPTVPTVYCYPKFILVKDSSAFQPTGGACVNALEDAKDADNDPITMGKVTLTNNPFPMEITSDAGGMLCVKAIYPMTGTPNQPASEWVDFFANPENYTNQECTGTIVVTAGPHTVECDLVIKPTIDVVDNPDNTPPVCIPPAPPETKFVSKCIGDYAVPRDSDPKCVNVLDYTTDADGDQLKVVGAQLLTTQYPLDITFKENGEVCLVPIPTDGKSFPVGELSVIVAMVSISDGVNTIIGEFAWNCMPVCANDPPDCNKEEVFITMRLDQGPAEFYPVGDACVNVLENAFDPDGDEVTLESATLADSSLPLEISFESNGRICVKSKFPRDGGVRPTGRWLDFFNNPPTGLFTATVQTVLSDGTDTRPCSLTIKGNVDMIPGNPIDPSNPADPSNPSDPSDPGSPTDPTMNHEPECVPHDIKKMYKMKVYWKTFMIKDVAAFNLLQGVNDKDGDPLQLVSVRRLTNKYPYTISFTPDGMVWFKDIYTVRGGNVSGQWVKFFGRDLYPDPPQEQMMPRFHHVLNLLANLGPDEFEYTVTDGKDSSTCRFTMTPRVNADTSPLAIDLDGDGQIGLTDRAVRFDIDGDGEKELLSEWFGSEDGILIRKPAGDEPLSGEHLFGDQGMMYSDGFVKLARRDTDADGQISGDELDGLAIWQDRNSDAELTPDEIISLEAADITKLSTDHVDFVSRAWRSDGSSVHFEDIWLPMLVN